MAKGMYFGVGSVARKIKKLYFGIGSVARKVKKIYIGVAGVARLAWSAGIGYIGVATALSLARNYLAAASVGNYVLFAGGEQSGSPSNVANVDSYNTSLTRSTPTALAVTRSFLAGASVGNYALFAGGNYGGGQNAVDAYNTSLVRSTPTALYEARYNLCGGSVGDYAAFAGGQTDHNGSVVSIIDFYNSSLVRTIYSGLAALQIACASVGDYIVFTGGYKDLSLETINKTSRAVNSSLVASTPADSFGGGLKGASAGNKNYAVFAAGGLQGVCAYNSSLVKSILTDLTENKGQHAGVSLNDFAVFAGGYTTTWTNTVDAYDSALVKSTPPALSQARYSLAGGKVGNYALFAGGRWSTSKSSTVDVYEA